MPRFNATKIAAINPIAKGSREIEDFQDAIVSSGPKYRGKCAITTKETLVDAATATGTGSITLTIASFIPAKSILLGVTAYVATTLAGSGLGSWSLGLTNHTTYYGTTLALTAGTGVDAGNWVVTAPVYCTTAVDVLFTGNAGVFSSGKVHLCAHYITVTAPTT